MTTRVVFAGRRSRMFLEQFFGFYRIHIGGRFIEDQYVGMTQHAAHEGD